MQLFVSDKGFICMVPVKSRKGFIYVFKEFCKEVGVPLDSIMDPAGEQTSGDVKKFAANVACNLKVLEEHTQHANLAELYIGIMKNERKKNDGSDINPIQDFSIQKSYLKSTRIFV